VIGAQESAGQASHPTDEPIHPDEEGDLTKSGSVRSIYVPARLCVKLLVQGVKTIETGALLYRFAD
jgi:hypothetical protein